MKLTKKIFADNSEREMTEKDIISVCAKNNKNKICTMKDNYIVHVENENKIKFIIKDNIEKSDITKHKLWNRLIILPNKINYSVHKYKEKIFVMPLDKYTHDSIESYLKLKKITFLLDKYQNAIRVYPKKILSIGYEIKLLDRAKFFYKMLKVNVDNIAPIDICDTIEYNIIKKLKIPANDETNLNNNTQKKPIPPLCDSLILQGFYLFLHNAKISKEVIKEFDTFRDQFDNGEYDSISLHMALLSISNDSKNDMFKYFNPIISLLCNRYSTPNILDHFETFIEYMKDVTSIYTITYNNKYIVSRLLLNFDLYEQKIKGNVDDKIQKNLYYLAKYNIVKISYIDGLRQKNGDYDKYDIMRLRIIVYLEHPNDNYYIGEKYWKTVLQKYDVLLEDLVEYGILLRTEWMHINNKKKDTFILWNKYAKCENIIKSFINMLLGEKKKIVTNKSILRNEIQNKAYISALEEPISIISGGPGTGKSHIIEKLWDTINQNNNLCYIMSFTGSAVNVLKRRIQKNNAYNDMVSTNLSTVDKFIISADTVAKKIHSDENYNKDVSIIIDEFSMISVKKFAQLLYQLYKNYIPVSHLILVGDREQLPSIDPGTLLYDLLYYGNKKSITIHGKSYKHIHHDNFGKIPVTILQKNFRSERSLVNLYTYVKQDNINRIFQSKGNYFYEPYNKQTLDNNIFNLFDGVSNSDNSVVIVPTNNLAKKINKMVKNILDDSSNPDKMEIGDTIICKNTFDVNISVKIEGKEVSTQTKIYNGDMYKIVRKKYNITTIRPIDSKNEYIITTSQLFRYFSLGYAITMHKSQGKEWNDVLVVLYTGNMLYTKNLLYTALTRAKKSCTLLATKNNVQICLDNPQKQVFSKICL